jgi:hypothetical protein
LENSIKFPSSETIDKLATAMEIDPADLFSKEDPTNSIISQQKFAFNTVAGLLGSMINTKIKELDEEIKKNSD